jgi:anion-transporting  ArsA/GET3 family ATPase
MDELLRLAPIVSRAKVVVCVGPGGVGKTSCSAAIGLHAARQGRRVAVLTIDPARRLANALGLDEIGDTEADIPASAFESLGLSPPKGRLSAMMLDIKSSWDQVIRRHHPDPEARARLLENRFYRALSSSLAGSQEYMAMEKLYELVHRVEDPLDLVVLDTPPAASAVDFLEAPSRMLAALDNDGTRWLINATSGQAQGLRQKVLGAGTSLFMRTLGKLTGVETLKELATMLSGFSLMYDGFQERAESVSRTLADPKTVFIVVSVPRAGPLKDARQFARRLQKKGLTLGAIVLNRFAESPFVDISVEDSRGGSAPLGPEVLARCVRQAGGRAGLAQDLFDEAERIHHESQQHQEKFKELRRAFSGLNIGLVPEFTGDIHDLHGLTLMESALFE